MATFGGLADAEVRYVRYAFGPASEIGIAPRLYRAGTGAHSDRVHFQALHIVLERGNRFRCAMACVGADLIKRMKRSLHIGSSFHRELLVLVYARKFLGRAAGGKEAHRQ